MYILANSSIMYTIGGIRMTLTKSSSLYGNIDKQQPRRYKPLVEQSPVHKPNVQHQTNSNNSQVLKSKVLVIDNISITISQNLDEDLVFNVDTKASVLSDQVTIPNIDICAKEAMVFDEQITLSKIESMIRRCGVLEEYSDFLVQDPDIVINSYTLNIHKTYQFFNEFKEGVLIGEEIFM